MVDIKKSLGSTRIIIYHLQQTRPSTSTFILSGTPSAAEATGAEIAIGIPQRTFGQDETGGETLYPRGLHKVGEVGHHHRPRMRVYAGLRLVPPPILGAAVKPHTRRATVAPETSVRFDPNKPGKISGLTLALKLQDLRDPRRRYRVHPLRRVGRASIR
jgi:hypothetical protein